MGNLGEHIAKMILHRNVYDLKLLPVIGSYRREEKKEYLIKNFSRMDVCESNPAIAHRSDVVILTVKPGQIKGVCQEIASSLTPDTIIISAAAAVPLAKLKEWLPNSQVIIRCMPNIPCSIGKGIVSYYSNSLQAESIMEKVFAPNKIIAVSDDSQVDASTLISGCGPAFFSWYAECIKRIGVDKLPPHILNSMIVETMSGTAALLNHHTAADIIQRVASPKGATEAALLSFKDNQVDVDITGALMSAQKRIDAMASTL